MVPKIIRNAQAVDFLDNGFIGPSSIRRPGNMSAADNCRAPIYATPMSKIHGELGHGPLRPNEPAAQIERLAYARSRRPMGQHVQGSCTPKYFPIGNIEGAGRDRAYAG